MVVNQRAMLPKGAAKGDRIQEKLEDKISEIDHQIEQLLTLRGELKGVLSGWESLPIKPEDTICPLIEKT